MVIPLFYCLIFSLTHSAVLLFFAVSKKRRKRKEGFRSSASIRSQMVFFLRYIRCYSCAPGSHMQVVFPSHGPQSSFLCRLKEKKQKKRRIPFIGFHSVADGFFPKIHTLLLVCSRVAHAGSFSLARSQIIFSLSSQRKEAKEKNHPVHQLPFGRRWLIAKRNYLHSRNPFVNR